MKSVLVISKAMVDTGCDISKSSILDMKMWSDCNQGFFCRMDTYGVVKNIVESRVGIFALSIFDAGEE